jgi:hypothetical protein
VGATVEEQLVVRTVSWITIGAVLGLIVGAFLGAEGLGAYLQYTNPGDALNGEFGGLYVLIGGFPGAVVGTILGAVLGAVLDAKQERGGGR